jgi:molybdopterin/thiamine biosynthesis adenylyltransferase
MTEAARYLRQVLLPEIGAEGQARIGASSARVAGETLAHEVAELYVRAAGFGRVEPGVIDVDALAPSAIVLSPSARALCAGSRAALAAMRAALGRSLP